jgi:hypothetical protein
MPKRLDSASTVVAVITFALFAAALFVKGFTHDLFLEAGVFLVSVKILMMMHSNHAALSQIDDKLGTILTALKKTRDPNQG